MTRLRTNADGPDALPRRPSVSNVGSVSTPLPGFLSRPVPSCPFSSSTAHHETRENEPNLAEERRFELLDGLHRRRFSKPLPSTTRPLLRRRIPCFAPGRFRQASSADPRRQRRAGLSQTDGKPRLRRCAGGPRSRPPLHPRPPGRTLRAHAGCAAAQAVAAPRRPTRALHGSRSGRGRKASPAPSPPG